MTLGNVLATARELYDRQMVEVASRPRPPVLSKDDFVKRYWAGEFGNASPTWQECDHFLQYGCGFPSTTGVPGLFHLRSRHPGGPTYYNLGWSECVAKWIDLGRENWYVSAMAPEGKKILQGEVARTTSGLYLNYNTLALPMREGMARESLHAERTKAMRILEHYLDGNSRDWLDVLLDRYPAHVVEFSTYSVQWGTVPGYNTVFWEVRAY